MRAATLARLLWCCVVAATLGGRAGRAQLSPQWGFHDGTTGIVGNYDYNKACVLTEDFTSCVECDTDVDCTGQAGEAGKHAVIGDRFGVGGNGDVTPSNNGDVRRRGNAKDGSSMGRCAHKPPVPPQPEFGYFTGVLNRSYVSNFTKTNVSYERVRDDARPCTDQEFQAAKCVGGATCLYGHGGTESGATCLCRAGTYGDPLVECKHCPSGQGRAGGVAWNSTSAEGSRTVTDCRTAPLSHWDTITLSNEVITVKLDQNGLRSSVFNDVSPKFAQAAGGKYGRADPGSGSVRQRALHECRKSALAATFKDDLSSHCRHLIGTSAGHGSEEGSGRVFRYVSDDFRIAVRVVASTEPGFVQTGATHVLTAGAMALEEFKLAGVGRDCGRDNCGGTSATYVYRSRQELPMPHHRLRSTHAFRADVKGPRGYVRPAHRPLSTSPARPRGSGGAAPGSAPLPHRYRVSITYMLEPGDEFVRKSVAVTSEGAVLDVVESTPFYRTEGCQVQRPSDDCPSRS
jgi:hypothetical protein